MEALLHGDLQKYRHRVIRLIPLDTDNLSIGQYNALCKNPSLYRCIDTELLLFFQVDSIILKENKALLDRFLTYDYVGAPWRDGCVGNGGLSLRRKSKMIEIGETVEPTLLPNEDAYFCYQTAVELHRPTFQDAQQFSVETVFHEKSFGVHAPWKYLNEYELGYLLQRYPDIRTLMALQ